MFDAMKTEAFLVVAVIFVPSKAVMIVWAAAAVTAVEMAEVIVVTEAGVVVEVAEVAAGMLANGGAEKISKVAVAAKLAVVVVAATAVAAAMMVFLVPAVATVVPSLSGRALAAPLISTAA